MNKLILAAAFMAMLSGCGDESTGNKVGDTAEVFSHKAYWCQDDTTQVRADFILQCVENANPMSDEEPEDYILECRYTSKVLYCNYGSVKRLHTWTGSEWVVSVN